MSFRYDQLQLKEFSEKVSQPSLGVDLAREVVDAVKELEFDSSPLTNDQQQQVQILHYKANVQGYLVLAELQITDNVSGE